MTIRDQIMQTIADAFGADRDVPARSGSEICPAGVVTQILEDDETATFAEYQTYTLETIVSVERIAEAKDASLTTSQANALLAELVVLIPAPADFLVTVDECRYQSGGPLRREGGSSVYGAHVSILVRYRYDLDDPSTLTE